MRQKRLRIFAGPNGSGKTTIIKALKAQISFGVYVNADDIEQVLTEKRSLNFTDYKIELDTETVQTFFKISKLSPLKHKDISYWKKLSVDMNQLKLSSNLAIDSYLAADIAELIRQTLLQNNVSFSYETVMSHPDKISFLHKAKSGGYRVYLYYIATEDPSININRVNVRVEQKGHAVPPETIEKRYYRSLENLKQAVRQTNRAFMFDNSGQASRLVAEITEGKSVEVFDPKKAPNWFVKYLVK